MGPYRLLQNFIFIIILNSIPLGSSQDWCPSDCICTVIPKTHQNHAKCTSLNGLLESKNLPIHSLDLSHANLTKINHLDKLRSLTTINLSHNKLSDIGHLGPRVKNINLNHNKITSAKLVNIPKNVVDLDVSFNEITYLPLELSKLNLRRIELFGNKLNCTCDTLEVRNFLVKNSVFTSHPVKCTYPIELKGTLWMQIKQEIYCKTETNDENDNTDQIKKINDDNENELMLGDAPITDGSEEKDKDGNEELGKDYMPINTNTDEVIDENVEGSGLSHLPMQNEHDEHQESSTVTETKSNEIIDPIDEENDEDGSGSGMGISHISLIENTSNESDANTTETIEPDDVSFAESEKPDSEESTPIPIPTDESSENSSLSFGLGIFGSGKNEETTETSNEEDTTGEGGSKSEEEEVTEEVVIPQLISVLENEDELNNVDVIAPGESDSPKGDMIQADIDKAEAGESNSTYILLGTVLIILVCLLMYVGLKKMIAKRKRNERDAERASELVDMDKKNLGKPLQKNGHEQKPLITGDGKPTTNGKKPGYPDNDPKIQEPLLNGHRKDPRDDESNNNLTKPQNQENANNIPVPEPRQSLQQQSSPQQQASSPKTHSPRFGGYPPPKSPRSPDSTDTGDSKSPSSPKTGRYSPVYSPETGKVKIKLTEVPKPKTPMLVTRSRSNAGEIVTTPTSDVVDSGVKNTENK